MFAGTIVYVYAGSSVPNLQTLADKGIGSVFSPTQLTQILVAFVELPAKLVVCGGVFRLRFSNPSLLRFLVWPSLSRYNAS